MKFPTVIAAALFATAATHAYDDPKFQDVNAYTHCRSFAIAYPGSTCDGMAAAAGISVAKFVALNRPLGSIEGCPTKLWADYWYCVEAEPSHPHGRRSSAV